MPEGRSPATVPGLIRELRMAAGLSQEELASRSGVTLEWYQRVEDDVTGRRTAVDLLERILDRLNQRLMLVVTPIGHRDRQTVYPPGK